MKAISSTAITVIVAVISVTLVGSYFLSREITERSPWLEGLGLIQPLETSQWQEACTLADIDCSCSSPSVRCNGDDSICDPNSGQSGADPCALAPCPGKDNASVVDNCGINYDGCLCSPRNNKCTGRTCTCDPTGICDYTCNLGWSDCDDDFLNNDCECETPADCCGGTGSNYIYTSCPICSGTFCAQCPADCTESTNCDNAEHTQICSAGSCQPCPAGFASCDQVSPDCEINLNTDPDNCGSCSHICVNDITYDSDGDDPYTFGYVDDYINSCIDGSCVYNTYNDYCSGTNNNDLTERVASGTTYTDKNYVGGTTRYCSSGMFIDCLPGTSNDDLDPSNGCEVITLSFTLDLPGETTVSSSGTPPGTETTRIEFYPPTQTEIDIEPCVYDWSCTAGHLQVASSNIPIFTFTNTGPNPEQWIISLSTDLPGYIELYGDTDNDRTGATLITTSDWVVDNNIPSSGSVDVYLWADFDYAAPPGTVIVSIYHRSTSA